jgi:hypothetical protein
MKNLIVKGFEYTNVFGKKVFDSVKILVPNDCRLQGVASFESIQNLDYSIPVDEIKHMERALALDFFARAYRPIWDNERTISVDELRGIQDVLEVNRSELGKLLGLHKGSVTNLFKGKGMKSSLCMLIMERLGLELARPGSARHMLDGGVPRSTEKTVQKVIDLTRFDGGDEVA